MSRAAPKISVAMPVYNGETYIEAAIESVLAQTFADFELLISDNASTDGTEEICRDFASRDPRLVYHRNRENIGAAANYNHLVDMAAAEHFRWNNADDLIAPDLHERCLEVLESRPDAVLSYGRTMLIDSDGNELEEYHDNLDLEDERPSVRFARFHEVVGMTNVIYGLMRTDAVRRSSRMGDGSYHAADTNFMGELVLYGKFVEIPQLLFYRRMHDASSTATSSDESAQTSFWTAGVKGFTLPSWRKNAAYVAAIRRAPIDSDEKRTLMLYMLRRMYRGKRRLLSELVGEAGKRVGLVTAG